MFKPRLTLDTTQRMIKGYYNNPLQYNQNALRKLSQHAQFYGLPFRQIEPGEEEFDIMRAGKNLVQGFVQGFTTLRTGEQPVNEYEQIARSVGSVLGFTGTIPVGKGFPILGAMKGKSIPLIVSGKVKKAISPGVTKGLAGLAEHKTAGIASDAAKYVMDTNLIRDIVGTSFGIGVASSVGQIWDGPQAMAQAFVGGARHTSGRTLLANIISLKDPQLTKVVRSLAGGTYTALPGHIRDESTPQQVYDFLLGSIFSYRQLPAIDKFAHKAMAGLQKEYQQRKIKSIEESDIYKNLNDSVRGKVRELWRVKMGNKADLEATNVFVADALAKYGLDPRDHGVSPEKIFDTTAKGYDQYTRKTGITPDSALNKVRVEATDMINKGFSHEKAINRYEWKKAELLKEISDSADEVIKPIVKEHTQGLDSELKALFPTETPEARQLRIQHKHDIERIYKAPFDSFIQDRVTLQDRVFRAQMQINKYGKEGYNLSEEFLDRSISATEIYPIGHPNKPGTPYKFIGDPKLEGHDLTILLPHKNLANKKVIEEFEIGQHLMSKPEFISLDKAYPKDNPYYKAVHNHLVNKAGYNEMWGEGSGYYGLKKHAMEEAEYSRVINQVYGLYGNNPEDMPTYIQGKPLVGRLQDAMHEKMGYSIGGAHFKAQTLGRDLFRTLHADPVTSKPSSAIQLDKFIKKHGLESIEQEVTSIWHNLSYKPMEKPMIEAKTEDKELVDFKMVDRNISAQAERQDSSRPIYPISIEPWAARKFDDGKKAFHEISHFTIDGKVREIFDTFEGAEGNKETNQIRQWTITKMASDGYFYAGGRKDHKAMRFYREHPDTKHFSNLTSIYHTLAGDLNLASKFVVGGANMSADKLRATLRKNIAEDRQEFENKMINKEANLSKQEIDHIYYKTWANNLLWLLERHNAIDPDTPYGEDSHAGKSYRYIPPSVMAPLTKEMGGAFSAKDLTKRLQILDSSAATLAVEDLPYFAEKAAKKLYPDYDIPDDKLKLSDADQIYRRMDKVAIDRYKKDNLNTIIIENDMAKPTGKINTDKARAEDWEAFMDGDIYMRPILMNMLNMAVGNSPKGGSIKSFQVNDPGQSILAGKNMSFSADKRTENFMRLLDVDQIALHGSIKIPGNRHDKIIKLSEFQDAVKDIRDIENPTPAQVDAIRARLLGKASEKLITDIHIHNHKFIPTTKFDEHNIEGKNLLVRQLTGTLASSLITAPDHIRGKARDFIDNTLGKSAAGDTAKTQHMEVLIHAEKPNIKQISKSLEDIDQVSVKTIVKMLNHSDSRVRAETLSAMLNKKDLDSDVEEGFEKIENAEIKNHMRNESSRFLAIAKDYKVAAYDDNHSKYLSEQVGSYLTKRIIKPQVENSMTLAIHTPSLFDDANKLWPTIDGKVQRNYFYLGAEAKDMKVEVRDPTNKPRSTTLGKLWQEYNDTEIGWSRSYKKYVQRIFNNVIAVRVPQDSIEGAQTLQMKGFTDHPSLTLLLHPSKKEALGGADDDGDKAHMYFGGKVKRDGKFQGKGLYVDDDQGGWAEIWKKYGDSRHYTDKDGNVRMRMPKTDTQKLSDNSIASEYIFEKDKQRTANLPAAPFDLFRNSAVTVRTRGDLGTAAIAKGISGSVLEALKDPEFKANLTGNRTVVIHDGKKKREFDLTIEMKDLKTGSEDVNKLIQSWIAFGSDPDDAMGHIASDKLQAKIYDSLFKITKGSSKEYDVQIKSKLFSDLFAPFRETNTALFGREYPEGVKYSISDKTHAIGSFTERLGKMYDRLGGINLLHASTKELNKMPEVNPLTIFDIMPKEDRTNLPDGFLKARKTSNDLLFGEIDRINEEKIRVPVFGKRQIGKGAVITEETINNYLAYLLGSPGRSSVSYLGDLRKAQGAFHRAGGKPQTQLDLSYLSPFDQSLIKLLDELSGLEKAPSHMDNKFHKVSKLSLELAGKVYEREGRREKPAMFDIPDKYLDKPTAKDLVNFLHQTKQKAGFLLYKNVAQAASTRILADDILNMHRDLGAIKESLTNRIQKAKTAKDKQALQKQLEDVERAELSATEMTNDVIQTASRLKGFLFHGDKSVTNYQTPDDISHEMTDRTRPQLKQTLLKNTDLTVVATSDAKSSAIESAKGASVSESIIIPKDYKATPQLKKKFIDSILRTQDAKTKDKDRISINLTGDAGHKVHTEKARLFLQDMLGTARSQLEGVDVKIVNTGESGTEEAALNAARGLKMPSVLKVPKNPYYVSEKGAHVKGEVEFFQRFDYQVDKLKGMKVSAAKVDAQIAQFKANPLMLEGKYAKDAKGNKLIEQPSEAYRQAYGVLFRYRNQMFDDMIVGSLKKAWKAEGDVSTQGRISSLTSASSILDNVNQDAIKKLYSTMDKIWDKAFYSEYAKAMSIEDIDKHFVVRKDIARRVTDKVTGVGAPLTPKTPVKPKYKGRMDFAYRDEKRPGIKAKTTLEAIRTGERTATTRYKNIDYWKKINVGDLVEFSNAKGEKVIVEVTTPLYSVKGMNAEEWSRLEGWDIAHYNKSVKPRINQAYQFQYKLVSPSGDEPVKIDRIPTYRADDPSKVKGLTPRPRDPGSFEEGINKANIKKARFDEQSTSASSITYTQSKNRIPDSFDEQPPNTKMSNSEKKRITQERKEAHERTLRGETSDKSIQEGQKAIKKKKALYDALDEEYDAFVKSVQGKNYTNVDKSEVKTIIERVFSQMKSHGMLSDDMPAEAIGKRTLGFLMGFTHKTLDQFSLQDWRAIDRWFDHYNQPSAWMKLIGKKSDTFKLSAYDWFRTMGSIGKDHMRNTVLLYASPTYYFDKDGNMKEANLYFPTQHATILEDVMGVVNSTLIRKEEDLKRKYTGLFQNLADTSEKKKLYEIMAFMKDVNYIAKDPEYRWKFKGIKEEQIEDNITRRINFLRNQKILPLMKELIPDAKVVKLKEVDGKLEIDWTHDKTIDIKYLDKGQLKTKPLKYSQLVQEQSNQITEMNKEMRKIIDGNPEVHEQYRIPATKALDYLSKKTGINLRTQPEAIRAYNELHSKMEIIDIDKLRQDIKNRMFIAKDIDITSLGIDFINKASLTDKLVEHIKTGVKPEDAMRLYLNSMGTTHTHKVVPENYYPHIDVDKIRMQPIWEKRLRKDLKLYKDKTAEHQTDPENVAKKAELLTIRKRIVSLYNQLNNVSKFDEVHNMSQYYNDLLSSTLEEHYKDGDMKTFNELSKWAKETRRSSVQMTRGIDELHYRTDPTSYLKYIKVLTNTASKNVGYFIAKDHIRQIEDNNLLGDYSIQWGNFFKMYITEAMGYPNVVTDDMLQDPKMKIKGNLYNAFTDKYVSDKVFNIKKKLGLEKNKYNLPEEFLKPTHEDLLKISQAEARFELMSLLAHTKATTLNMFGGASLTAISAGLDNWTKAKSGGYISKHIHPSLATMKDRMQFVARHGIIEEHLIHEAGILGKTYGANFEKFVKAASAKFKKDPLYSDVSLNKLANEYGIKDAVFDKAAVFMRYAERVNRTDSFMAHYLQAQQMFGGMDNKAIKDGKFFGDPILIEMAKKGVRNTQFFYSSAYRPAIARTSFGKILTRFKLWTYNHIKFRSFLQEQARVWGYEEGTLAQERLNRMMVFDMVSLALSSMFMGSIFESVLPPPLDWAQDFANWLFGDDREKERAFYGAYPRALAPLQVITPPIARAFPNMITGILYGDWKTMTNYTAWTMFPFGRIMRDARRSVQRPEATIDNMTGIPLTRISEFRQPAYTPYVK